MHLDHQPCREAAESGWHSGSTCRTELCLAGTSTPTSAERRRRQFAAPVPDAVVGAAAALSPTVPPPDRLHHDQHQSTLAVRTTTAMALSRVTDEKNQSGPSRYATASNRVRQGSATPPPRAQQMNGNASAASSPRGRGPAPSPTRQAAPAASTMPARRSPGTAARARAAPPRTGTTHGTGSRPSSPGRLIALSAFDAASAGSHARAPSSQVASRFQSPPAAATESRNAPPAAAGGGRSGGG